MFVKEVVQLHSCRAPSFLIGTLFSLAGFGRNSFPYKALSCA